METTAPTDTDTIRFRFAHRDDLSTIISMLADDALGAGREVSSDDGPYLAAFDDMEAQGENKYLLAVDAQDQILGCLQITLIAGLSRSGMKRALLEGIRVAETARGQGIGRHLLEEAHEIARRAHCGLVQLTTDRTRTDALRFYESLGYENSHNGMKLRL